MGIKKPARGSGEQLKPLGFISRNRLYRQSIVWKHEECLLLCFLSAPTEIELRLETRTTITE